MSSQKTKILETGIFIEGSGAALYESYIKYPTYDDIRNLHEETFHVKEMLRSFSL